MNDNQQPQAKTPGAILRAARELRAYEQSDVAQQLRLSVQTIKDIEADDYSHFTAEIYLRGHLRSYARLCELDPAVVLQSYEALGIEVGTESRSSVILAQEVSASGSVRRAKHRTLVWVGLGVLLFLVLMVALWWREQGHHGTQVQVVALKKKIETIPVVLIKIPPHNKPVKKIISKKKATLSKKSVHRKTVLVVKSHQPKKRFVPDYSFSPVKK